MNSGKMNGFYPVLNEIHDKAAKELPLAELALFEHIWRKLIGWNKFEDEISYSQLAKETLASRRTIIRLLKKLEDKRWIKIQRQSEDGINDINIISIPECPSVKMSLGWCQNVTRGSDKSTPGGSDKMTHTTDSSFTDISTDNIYEGKPENFDKIISLFQNMAPGQWQIQNDYQRQKVLEFCEVPIEKIEACLQRAGSKGRKWYDLVDWVSRGLENWDQWYGGGNGDGKPKLLPARCREEIEILRKEREAVLAAPESDFTERRILRQNVIGDIDMKIERYQAIMKGETTDG